MWGDFLKNVLMKPLLERLGTAGAVAIITAGDAACKMWEVACGLVTTGGAHEAMKWVAAAALVAFDLALSYINRKPR